MPIGRSRCRWVTRRLSAPLFLPQQTDWMEFISFNPSTGEMELSSLTMTQLASAVAASTRQARPLTP